MFNLGDFMSHSGKYLSWKIECDDLSPADLDCFAYLVSRFMPFNEVIGVPQGGIRLAKALEHLVTPSAPFTLLVDDVFTTGASLLQARYALGRRGVVMDFVRGVVLFARRPPPEWITAVFTYNLWIP